VQHLSDVVHSQIFPAASSSPPQELVELSKDHLTRHDLLGKNQDNSDPIAFDLPPLHGTTLDEHFYRLGMDAAEPYLANATAYTQADPPPKPKKWVKRSGWTKYNADGTTEKIDAPDADVLTFDVETMWRETNFACMAVASSPTAWYSWLSPWLLGESKSDRHLIPLGDPKVKRIVVGHNIGYDRARIAEEYDLTQSNTFFIDTMSLHVAANGMCSRQRPTWVKHRKNKELRDEIEKSHDSGELAVLLENGDFDEEEVDPWVGRSSVNSLKDVALFHCGVEIDKGRREYFGELDRDGILERLDELMDYCADDVDITYQVYRKVFPAFLETCPHPVSFASLRHLSSEILPVNKTWESYISNAEATYQSLSDKVQERLINLAEKALKIKTKADEYTNDPWLSQLDWSGQEIRMVKGNKKGDPPRPAARQKMPGSPNWYKDLFPTADSDINLTVRTRIAPLLLRLTWNGYPLVWCDKYGFTYKVPLAEVETLLAKGFTELDMSEDENMDLKNDEQHTYFKLPHKDGPQARCTNPLAKGYLQYFENGTLSSEFPYAKAALEMNASCSYWISARERIMNQMVVYADEIKDPEQKKRRTKASLAYILPQVVPMGTITRRAVENTWLTASNAKPNRVGSELKSMVTAPKGWCFVGADVDSQELWIASLVGDAQFQLHGGNAIGFMTLEGTKAAGTDLHSRTAEILQISRNDAKVFNYSRIYGAGQKHAIQLLRQFNPTITDGEAARIAAKLYLETKGKRSIRKQLNDRSFWRGGSESFVFNRLEDFAEQAYPQTPVLGAGITEALQRRNIGKGGFLPSRINWAIQSSGVDYLHLLIVSMDHLIRRYGLTARLAITVHDEIRYLVAEKDKYRAAMALQTANVWTRAMFSSQLGIDDLPQSCAYFSAVDIDHVLRKEVDMDCITPSHPNKIPPGESLDICQLLEKGNEAFLDPAAKGAQVSDLTRFEYEPRVPVIKALERDDQLLFLKAQISQTDDELRDIIREKQGVKSKTAKSAGRKSSSGTGSGSSGTSKPKTEVRTRRKVRVAPPDDAIVDVPAPELAEMSLLDHIAGDQAWNSLSPVYKKLDRKPWQYGPTATNVGMRTSRGL
jgi:DNA polymerase gamma 1